VRIALLSYRSKEHCGGQGVYVKHLSRGLAELGHEVEIFSGPPYPEEIDPRVNLTEVPSLDIYAREPIRAPRPRLSWSRHEWLEWAVSLTGSFPEPLAFSTRAAALLRSRRGDFDVVHDNQCLGYGLFGIQRHGFPLVATIHHPISRDRRVELASVSGLRKLSVARWYGFVRMQARVARRLPALVGVSDVAAADAVADFGIPEGRFSVIPLGVDTDVFRPRGERVRGRIVAVASADHPLKGVAHLLDAVAKLRVDHEIDLQLVSALAPGGATARRIEQLGLADCLTLSKGLSDDELAALMASAEVVAVPSLYEGFSLPTVEALACGTAVVASRAGALPEVVGTDGDCALLVPPGDVEALVTALRRLLDSAADRQRLGAAGRARALERFSWRSVAEATVAVYREAIAASSKGSKGRRG
jgi:glycosyltransferase involved in cell wall biosynthesis